MFRIDIDNIKDFILLLDSEKIYVVIPFISITNKSDDPQIILSRQILITKYSSPLIVHNYINDQLETAIRQFSIDDLQVFYLHLNFKQVKIFYNFLNQI